MFRRIREFFKPSKLKRQSGMFHKLLEESRCVSREKFAANFGGIPGDVMEMFNSEQARQAVQKARKDMEDEKNSLLPSGEPRLRQEVQFGLLSKAKELEDGTVAAIDGTFALPMQTYSAGQAICVGIGSLSHCRPMQDSLHYWSSKVSLSEATHTDDFIVREERGLFGISQTAYLRYYEVEHGLKINEPYLFLDGPLVDKYLVSSEKGIELYNRLFENEKQAIGIIKNLKGNPVFTKFARALKPREIYVIETLEEHLNQSNATRNRYVLEEFKNSIARDIFRGVFKPRNKVFGFEVYKDHLENMLHIMAADCQMNNSGHEIPFLLNRIDEEVRKNFNAQILTDQIAIQMATQSEELFFEETDERTFRYSSQGV